MAVMKTDPLEDRALYLQQLIQDRSTPEALRKKSLEELTAIEPRLQKQAPVVRALDSAFSPGRFGGYGAGSLPLPIDALRRGFTPTSVAAETVASNPTAPAPAPAKPQDATRVPDTTLEADFQRFQRGNRQREGQQGGQVVPSRGGPVAQAAPAFAPITAPELGVNSELTAMRDALAQRQMQGAPRFENVDSLTPYKAAMDRITPAKRQALSEMSDNDQGMLWTKLGLGLMAGKNANFGANLGESGAETLKEASAMQKQRYDEAVQENALKTARAGQEATLRGSDVNARNTNAAAAFNAQTQKLSDVLRGTGDIAGVVGKRDADNLNSKVQTGATNASMANNAASNDTNLRVAQIAAAASRATAAATDRYREDNSIAGRARQMMEMMDIGRRLVASGVPAQVRKGQDLLSMANGMNKGDKTDAVNPEIVKGFVADTSPFASERMILRHKVMIGGADGITPKQYQTRIREIEVEEAKLR